MLWIYASRSDCNHDIGCQDITRCQSRAMDGSDCYLFSLFDNSATVADETLAFMPFELQLEIPLTLAGIL